MCPNRTSFTVQTTPLFPTAHLPNAYLSHFYVSVYGYFSYDTYLPRIKSICYVPSDARLWRDQERPVTHKSHF